MSAHALPREDALQAGADLWIVADLERSAWTRRIDWYLNFQIFRSGTHAPLKPTPELEQVLSRWEIEAPAGAPSGTSVLMVASGDRLPNHAVVMVPFEGVDPGVWAEEVHRVWSRLDAPRMRVFLPAGLTADRFVAAWPGPGDALARALVHEI